MRRVAAALVLALALAALPFPVLADVPEVPFGSACGVGVDFPIDGGWFFTQTGSDTGRGYPVVDDDAAKFWSAFQDLGGIQAVGYPVSHRFMLHGFLVQAFQKMVLQWDPSKNGVNVANTMDVLNRDGHDDWLETFRQVPRHATLPEDAGVPFSKIIENHLALLDVNPAIRDAYFAVPSWLTRLGLPIAYGDFGDMVAIRTQRAVLQQWLVDVDWARAGQVVFANSGDLAKEAGQFPPESIEPIEHYIPSDVENLVAVDSAMPQQGDAIGVRVRTAAGGVTLSWNGQPAPLLCRAGEWHAVLGTASTAMTGPQELQVSVGERMVDVSVELAERPFPAVEFQIPESLEDLLDDAVAQEERDFLYSIVQRVSGGPIWTGQFQRPSSGRVTSPYGERRTLQPGSFMSVHEGVDFAASTGTAIPAPNRGRVAFVGPLTIRGNTVILDHGFGVYTLFYHLHDFSASLGQVVERGATVGFVGSTGRSTGPHIHWEMYVAGATVDPVRWVDGPFYTLGDAESFVPAPAGDSDPVEG